MAQIQTQSPKGRGWVLVSYPQPSGSACVRRPPCPLKASQGLDGTAVNWCNRCALHFPGSGPPPLNKNRKRTYLLTAQFRPFADVPGLQGSIGIPVHHRRTGVTSPPPPPQTKGPIVGKTKFTAGKIWSGQFWDTNFWVPDPLPPPPFLHFPAGLSVPLSPRTAVRLHPAITSAPLTSTRRLHATVRSLTAVFEAENARCHPSQCEGCVMGHAGDELHLPATALRLPCLHIPASLPTPRGADGPARRMRDLAQDCGDGPPCHPGPPPGHGLVATVTYTGRGRRGGQRPKNKFVYLKWIFNFGPL